MIVTTTSHTSTGARFMSLVSMARGWMIALMAVFATVCAVPVYAQYADPAVSGANFTPISVLQGNTSELKISFVNSGSTFLPGSTADIPAFSI